MPEFERVVRGDGSGLVLARDELDGPEVRLNRRVPDA
jgi:hypothetical protein